MIGNAIAGLIEQIKIDNNIIRRPPNAMNTPQDKNRIKLASELMELAAHGGSIDLDTGAAYLV